MQLFILFILVLLVDNEDVVRAECKVELKMLVGHFYFILNGRHKFTHESVHFILPVAHALQQGQQRGEISETNPFCAQFVAVLQL